MAAAKQLQNLRWLTTLEELILAGTAADISTVQAVCGLPRLRSLCLSETAVTDESLPYLATLQGPLAELALSSLPITGETLTARHWGRRRLYLFKLLRCAVVMLWLFWWLDGARMHALQAHCRA